MAKKIPDINDWSNNVMQYNGVIGVMIISMTNVMTTMKY